MTLTQTKATKHFSLAPVICPYTFERPVDWNRQFHREAPLEVEIGFGMGEVLMRMAGRSPQINYVGIEQHWQRLRKTLSAIARHQALDPSSLTNIRLLKADARDVFERMFNPRTIDAVYCLFPCPWPKKGHVKHRLFSKGFLRLLNSRLKTKGKANIVTDSGPYCDWIMDEVRRTGFAVEKRLTSSEFNTKFGKKWRAEGKNEFFELKFSKKSHVHIPVKKDVALKSYAVKQCDPGRLRLDDVKGDASVIFKNLLFDRVKKRAMVHTIVTEDHLTQHFWVTIVQKEDKWIIAKADGQNFYPTRGIAKAIYLVYKAARDT